MKGDINDTLRVEGLDGVRARHDQAQKYNGAVFATTDYAKLNRDLDALFGQTTAKPNGPAPILAQSSSRKTAIQTAADLRMKKFEPLKYVIPALITEGLWILAGRPKVKKSWFALDIALAKAMGRLCLGNRKPEQGAVLYLALEDSERRLQRRIDQLLQTFSAEWPENFHYATQWPRADKGGVEKIDEWCGDHPDAGLIVIDVLAKFRAPSAGKNLYQEDYAAMVKLQELTTRRGIGVLGLHHTRKAAGDDPVDELSGTLGLAGSTDGFFVLKKTAGGTVLVGRGRDTEDVDLAMEFNDATCRWTIIGDAAEVRHSDQQGRVLAALKNAEEGLPTNEIMAAAELASRGSADVLLGKMAAAGDVERLKRGLYGLPGNRAKLSSARAAKIDKKLRSEPKSLKQQEDVTQSYNLSDLSSNATTNTFGSTS
jgi:hypothetical protein